MSKIHQVVFTFYQKLTKNMGLDGGGQLECRICAADGVDGVDAVATGDEDIGAGAKVDAAFTGRDPVVEVATKGSARNAIVAAVLSDTAFWGDAGLCGNRTVAVPSCQSPTSETPAPTSSVIVSDTETPAPIQPTVILTPEPASSAQPLTPETSDSSSSGPDEVQKARRGRLLAMLGNLLSGR